MMTIYNYIYIYIVIYIYIHIYICRAAHLVEPGALCVGELLYMAIYSCSYIYSYIDIWIYIHI